MLITHFSKLRFIVLLCLILWSPLLAPEAASQTRGWGGGKLCPYIFGQVARIMTPLTLTTVSVLKSICRKSSL